MDKDKVSILEAKLEKAKNLLELLKQEKAVMKKLEKALKDKVSNMKLLKDKKKEYYTKFDEVQKLKDEYLKAQKQQLAPPASSKLQLRQASPAFLQLTDAEDINKKLEEG